MARADSSISTSIENSKDGKHKIVHAEFVVERPATCVWQQLSTPEQFPQFIPRLSKARHLDSQEGKEKFFVIINPPFPFKEIINVLSVKFEPGKKEIHWEMLDGNIEKNDGHVSLAAAGKNTKITMDVLLDFGGAWPKTLVAWGIKYYLPKVLRSIGQRTMESDCKATEEKIASCYGGFVPLKNSLHRTCVSG